MTKFCVMTLGLVAAAIGVVSAVTEQEKNAILSAIMPVLVSCSSEIGVTEDQVLAAKKSTNVDDLNPCYYACFFKKTGLLNDQGLFDAEFAKANHQKYINGANDIKQLDDIVNACISVNDKVVSDGAKGCERAKLLVQCMKDNQGSFNPFD